jgi:hypothetical protein
VFLLADDLFVGCFYRSEQNGHRRDQRACALYLCYSHPSLRFGLRMLRTLCLLSFKIHLAEVLLVLLVNDSEYKHFPGTQPTPGRRGIYIVSPGARGCVKHQKKGEKKR